VCGKDIVVYELLLKFESGMFPQIRMY
jgi:hypothetical protein